MKIKIFKLTILCICLTNICQAQGTTPDFAFALGKTKQNLFKKIEKETITYFTYGELPPVGYIYYDTVFKMPKYAFKIKNMGGCEPIGVDYEKLSQTNNSLTPTLNITIKYDKHPFKALYH